MLKLDIQRFEQMGYNEGLIHGLISKEQEAYDQIMIALGSKMTSMAEDISKLWYAGNAVTFFTQCLKPMVDDTANLTTKQFENIISVVNESGGFWARTTENSYSAVNFAPSGEQIDVSSVREADGNGSSYMEKDATSSTFSTKLTEVSQAVNDALETARTAASNSGFLSSQNEGALQQSLSAIANNFNNMIQTIRTELNNSMNAKEDAYKFTESQIDDNMTIG